MFSDNTRRQRKEFFITLKKLEPTYMKRILFTSALCALMAFGAKAQTPAVFTPGYLAVFQEGNAGTNRCLPLGAVTGITNYSPEDIFGSRQNQIFIDQFDPNGLNQTNPSVRLAVPTNGYSAMLVNGNAGTEGYMTLSDDRSVLTFAAYAGDILSQTTGGQTAPSNIAYDRAVATVDAFTNLATIYRGTKWYGTATGKTNPRGVSTDGLGHFYGCGNGYGTLYYDVAAGDDPAQLQAIALTSCSRVQNHKLFNSVKGSESVNLFPAGVYTMVDFDNNPVDLPNAFSFLHLYLPAQAPYTNCIGFDINPSETVAYVCDDGGKVANGGGIQKYVRSGQSWKLAYNLAIPGYNGLNNGVMVDVGSTNTLVGCYSVSVDWSGPNPVVYATTADSGVNLANPYYGNRVIRINDTNTIQDGSVIIALTNILTTVARPPLVNGLQATNIVYKSVAFTPDLRPIITNQPASWSAAEHDNVSFSVGATANYAISYQWLQNGTNLAGQTSATLALSDVSTTMNGYTYQCIVSNFYGVVNSSVATLTVTPTAVLPVINLQNFTNYVGNNVSLTTSVGGTDPKGGYQWYFNGNALADGATGNGSTLSGTTSSTLNIQQAAITDAGNYSVSVTNIAGSTSNTAASLTLIYAAPIFVQPPQPITTFVGRTVTNVTSAYGQLLTNQWYSGFVGLYTITNTTTVITTNGVQLSSKKTSTTVTLGGYVTNVVTDGVSYSGSTAPKLTLLSVQTSQSAQLTVLSSLAFSTNNSFKTTGTTIVTNTYTTNVVSSVATNFSGYYSVVYGNPAGSITSSAAPLTVTVAPAHTFVSYTNQIYKQDFNSLPIPAGSSAEGGNPLTILNAVTNAAGINAANPTNVIVLADGNQNTNIIGTLSYSMDNPLDFGYPVFASGGIGGYGLASSMSGWYGWCQKSMVVSATFGDQSQGAIVNNGGVYRADGSSLAGVTNRALGLVATSKTGVNCIGIGFINSSTHTNNSINLSFLGELWRNNPNQQVLQFGYAIDPAGASATFSPAVADGSIVSINGNTINSVTDLNVTFVTNASSTFNDGTQLTNQVYKEAKNLIINDWAPGQTLWLVWQANTLGTAQDVAIDNLKFSAAIASLPAVVQVGANTYSAYDTTLTNGQWVYVDSDPAAGSPVRATQRSLGYREVDYKKQVPPTLFFSAVSPTTNSGVLVYDYTAQANSTNLVGFWAAKDVPIVIGTDGLAYITDGHHTTAGYLAASSLSRDIVPGQKRIILGHIVANYYNTNTGPVDVNDAWWTARAAENNAFLYGTNGDLLTLSGEPNYANLQPILPSVLAMPTTPSTLTGNGVVAMLASKYRGLTWGLADAIVVSGTTSAGVKIPGYKKAAPGSAVDLNFVEFYWADFLRNRIVWDDTLSGSPYGSANGDASVTAAPLSFFTAVANGIALARSEVYRDEYGRLISAYTNSVLFPPTTVNWAQGSISNGFAKVTDTYHMFIRNDSTIAGDITPSALSTNILHIDAATALTVTNVASNFLTVIVNGGSTLTTKWKDSTVTNSTLTLPAGTATVTFNGTLTASSLVVSNGTLGGNGIINGAVTVNAGATLAPGSSIGTLTVNGPVSLNGTTVMEINKSGVVRTSDLLTGVTTLTRGGTLTVTATGTALVGGDSFHLFIAGNYAGSFATINLPTLASGLAWDTHNLGVNGNIAVVSTTAVSLAPNFSGGNLNLTWPSDHAGWRLEIQTNTLSTGLGTNWFTWPNSADSTSAAIPVDPANGSVFLRLAFP